MRWWLLGLGMKLVGSAWDVAWHFKLLADATSPAHMINIAGDVVIGLAFLADWRDRTPARQGPLNAIAVGFGMVLVAIPSDLLWHRIFGLDLTTWSPTHLLLFGGTAVVVAGATLLFLVDSGWKPGEAVCLSGGDRLALLALGFFLVEAFAFPLAFHEYSTVGAWDLAHAPSKLSPEIRDFGRSISDPIWRGVPPALYPGYSLFVCVFFGVAIALATGRPRYAAGALVAMTVVRACAIEILAWRGWPESVIPFQYATAGLGIALAFAIPGPERRKAAFAAMLGFLAGAGALLAEERLTLGVPVAARDLPLALAASFLAAGLAVAFVEQGLPRLLRPRDAPFDARVRRIEARIDAWRARG
jgi:hypothetical protein